MASYTKLISILPLFFNNILICLSVEAGAWATNMHNIWNKKDQYYFSNKHQNAFCSSAEGLVYSSASTHLLDIILKDNI